LEGNLVLKAKSCHRPSLWRAAEGLWEEKFAPENNEKLARELLL